MAPATKDTVATKELPLVSGVRHRVEGQRGIRFFDSHWRKIDPPAAKVRASPGAAFCSVWAARSGDLAHLSAEGAGWGLELRRSSRARWQRLAVEN